MNIFPIAIGDPLENIVESEGKPKIIEFFWDFGVLPIDGDVIIKSESDDGYFFHMDELCIERNHRNEEEHGDFIIKAKVKSIAYNTLEEKASEEPDDYYFHEWFEVLEINEIKKV